VTEEDLSLGPSADSESIVTDFFTKFVVNSEGSSASDNVDIVLLMKAIPTKIHINNINDVRKFNFLVLEDAIIAYENKEDVTSFEFYDKKNKKRVSDVKDTVSD